MNGINKFRKKLSKHKKPIIMTLTVIFLVIAIYIIYINLPYFFMGPPEDFLYIRNRDDNSHDLHVRIYDSDNEQIIDKRYNLDAHSTDKYVNRYPSDHYRVNVTLDNNLTTEKIVEIHDEWTTIHIAINTEDYVENGYDERVSIGITQV